MSNPSPSPTDGTSSPGVVGAGPKETPHRPRRNKYISRACQDCQRRKVKCSGEDKCLHCRVRDVPCVYVPRSGPDGRRRRRVRTSTSEKQQMSEARGQDERGDAAREAGGSPLQDRLSLLQKEFEHAAECNRIPFPRQQIDDMPHKLRDDAYALGFNAIGNKSTSLAPKQFALREFLRPDSIPPLPLGQALELDRTFPLEFPRPSELRYLLDIYFRGVDTFFPYLEQEETEARIVRTLEDLGYSEYVPIIDVNSQSCALMALLCNMLVMGQCMDPHGERFEGPMPGWTMYLRGRKLMHHCLSAKSVSLDVIRYHTLSAIYMLHSQLLQPASQAIATAVQLAMMAKLNIQAAWDGCPPAEVESRKKLWWVIYFLDRRIAQRNDSPFLIRDIDVAVESFEPTAQDPRKVSETAQFRHPSQRAPGASSLSYMQFLIETGKLWAHIWDSFFAAGALKRGDWREVEIADAQILFVRRQLPPDLTWNTELVETYVSNGEEEPQLRRRLSTFIRTNLLRMIIRQNPSASGRGDEEAMQTCTLLARLSIEAIAAYTTVCPAIRCSGTFFITHLVECIQNIVYGFQGPTIHSDGSSAAVESFRTACRLLAHFAQTLEPARQALEALKMEMPLPEGAAALFEAMTVAQNERSIGGQVDRSHEAPNIANCSPTIARNSEYSAPPPTSNSVPSASDPLLQTQPARTNYQMQSEGVGQPLACMGESDFIHDLDQSYGDWDIDSAQMLLDGM